MNPMLIGCLFAGLLAGLLLLLLGRWQRQGTTIFGPLFWHEMTLLVRRRQHFLIRFFYPLSLLAVLLFFFLSWTDTVQAPLWTRLTEPVISAQMMAGFASSFFYLFAVVQFVVFVLVTLHSSSGAITEEKERHRLDFLLATPLENHEIVLGKMAARLATTFVLALGGVPVLSFLTFVGGIDPVLLAGVTAFTFITLLSVAALAVTCSVYARQTRKALDSTMQLVMVYHVFSGVLWILLAPFWNLANWPSTATWDSPITLTEVVHWCNAGNAVAAVVRVAIDVDGGMSLDQAIVHPLLGYALFHGVVFLVCCRIAVTRLRAAARLEGEGAVEMPPNPAAGESEELPAVRPPVSDQPILWKSLYLEDDTVAGSGRHRGLLSKRFPPEVERIFKAILFSMSVVVPVALALLLSYHEPRHVHEAINGIFRTMATLIGCAAWLRVTGHACATVAGEREIGTLPDLLLTRLDRREILHQKWLGSLLTARWLVAWLGCCAITVAILGGLHPLAIPLFFLIWGGYAVFLVNLGLLYSVLSATKRLAGRRTFLSLFAVMMLGVILWWTLQGDAPGVGLLGGFMLVLFAPVCLGLSAWRADEISDLFHQPGTEKFFLGIVAGLFCLGVATLYCHQRAREWFEHDKGENPVAEKA